MIDPDLEAPYLLFLGDAARAQDAATAAALARWRPEECVGQLRYANARVDCGLPDMDIGQARRAGARSLVIGVTTPDGTLKTDWESTLVDALAAGLDVVGGPHTPLESIPRLANAAYRSGSRLVDLRRLPEELAVADGRPRSGRRLLTVGTQRDAGPLDTALALHQALRQGGVDARFRASSPTGMLIAGRGVALDSVPAEYLAGVAEQLCPANDPDHWDIVEGQGSLLHPASAAITLGLMHGVRPDALVLCHQAGRTRLDGWPGGAIPPLSECIERHLQAAKPSSPAAHFIGIALDTTGLAGDARRAALAAVENETNLPCADPLADGAEALLAWLPATTA